MNKIKCLGLPLTGMLFFSIAFLSVSAFAQTGTLEVTGIGPSGAPEKDVKVIVMPATAVKGKDKKTNAAGLAVFDRQNNGVYRVVGRKEGFAPALHEFAVVNSDKASVTLNMTPGADRKLYFEDQALEQQADLLLNQGLKAVESGNVTESEKSFAQALEIKPSAPDIIFYSGMVKANLGKYDEALESFKKAIDFANLMLAAMPKPKPGDPGERLTAVYETIAKNAEQQINLIPVMRADAAYGAKKFDAAVVLYDEAVKLNPQNPILYSNKALALVQTSKFDEALVAVNRALELDPGNQRSAQVKKTVETLIANAAREKANALLAEGSKLLDSDAASALKKFEEANTISGEKEAVIWRSIGRARAKLKQDAEAVTAFKKAVELAPADQTEGYQMSLAQYYLDANRPEEAIDVVAAGAKNPEQRLMELFAKTKNSPDSAAFSLAALERVVKLNPMNLDAVFELGQVYYLDRKDDQAREFLTRYIENGKDEEKLQGAKDLMTVIASRNKSKS